MQTIVEKLRNFEADMVEENRRLRTALQKIAADGYTREDEALTSDQPMMIWQLVAAKALEQ